MNDDPCAVRENLHRFWTAIGAEGNRVARTRQVHSNRVNVVSSKTEGFVGDALITRAEGQWLAVSVADCVPVYLLDARHMVVGMVHAGWRGTLEGIVRACVEKMKSEFGSDPAQTSAVVGPGIGPCCFEVSQDTAARFEEFCPGSMSGGHVDLFKANRSELEKLGVECQACDPICTSCNEELFFSHRRDKGVTGRMLAMITLIADVR